MAAEVQIEREQRGRSWYFKLVYEGKEVSRLWVHDLKVRFGESIVRMGGIGGVETDEPYRRRGFARRLLETANEFMREAGFDIAGLFGISDFYERWGYIPALPEYQVKVATENIKNAQLKHKVDDYSHELHSEEVLRIYEHNNLQRICSVVRERENWSGFRMGSDWFVKADVKVFVDEGTGEIAGYISLDDVQERTTVAEVGYATPKVFESIVAFLAQRATERGHEEITLLLPPDHKFTAFLRQYGCTATQIFHRSGGGMMRIINLESTMRKLSVELTKRLRNSPFRNYNGKFAIVTDIGSVGVKVFNEKVSFSLCEPHEIAEKLELPQGKLMQLLTGYQTIDTLAINREVHCPADLIPFFRVMFPLAYPYIWWADRF